MEKVSDSEAVFEFIWRCEAPIKQEVSEVKSESSQTTPHDQTQPLAPSSQVCAGNVC